MPKFRGNSDDWLDDETESSGKSGSKRSRKPPRLKAEALPPEQSNAIVVEVFPNQCRVRVDDGKELLCSYRRAQLLGSANEKFRDRTPVAVGDRVSIEFSGMDTGVVLGACARKNWISRRDPGTDQTVQHVIAANIDLVVVIASVREPNFSPGLVDRFLIAAQTGQVQPILCISKMDLLEAESHVKNWAGYRELGITTLEVSVRSGSGMDHLRGLLQDRTVLFCGHSGVGKTSLLQGLMAEKIGRVGEVNKFTGKGKHTTTSSILFRGPDRSQWIDTPGIREFGIWGNLRPEELASFFPEFSNLPCTASGCLHSGEPACSAVGLFRYSSYQRIFKSLEAGEY